METKQEKKLNYKKMGAVGVGTVAGGGLGVAVAQEVFLDEITGEVGTGAILSALGIGAGVGGFGACLLVNSMIKAADDPHAFDEGAKWLGRKYAQVGKWFTK